MKKRMKCFSMLALVAGLTLGLGSSVFAKGYSSSRSSSSSRSYSSSSSKSGGGFGATRTKTATVKPTLKTTSVSKKTAVKSGGGFGSSKKIDTGSAKYKSVNSKITKDFGTSTKTYKSKSAAKADLSSKMASKKYNYKDSKTAMANRPANIPQSYRGRPTAYYNGCYGRYDDSGLFLAYAAQQMIITDMMVHSYAPNAAYVNQPVRVESRHYNPIGVAVGLFVMFMLTVLIFKMV